VQVPESHRDSAGAYETLVEFLYLTPVGIIKFRPCGTIEMANPAAVRLLLPIAPDADMANLFCLLAPLLPDLRARVEAFEAATGSICEQMQLPVPASGQVLTLSVNKIDADTLMAVIQDITCAIEQEARIRDDQERFRAIFENVRDYAIYTVGLDGRVDTWNRSLSRIGGWEATDVIGQPISRFLPLDTADQAAALLERARQCGTAEFEGWRVRKDGSRFWGNTVAATLLDRREKPSGFVLVTRDLTERKQIEDRLLALTITDPLTGAFNRRAGEARLAEAFRAWRRSGDPFCVLMIDCDHFKAVNDTWGHDGGDEVLIALVRICRERLRDRDATFRWGGEEFMVLLADPSTENAVAVAERLRSGLAAAEIFYDGQVIRITVSIGVTRVHELDADTAGVIRRADRALYDAKEAGRNRVTAT
jgi:diguanylate cyclase (GGDEF)-like protein/PAS domain S-box-containing protein